jgi:hypothetical protein
MDEVLAEQHTILDGQTILPVEGAKHTQSTSRLSQYLLDVR